MAASSPLVTIGITAYNAAETIECSVRSALAQDWANTEIIIVDDASSDGTYEVLEKLARESGCIRLFKNEENSGVAMSRNVIITEACGDFIAFFDDDDSSMPSRITAQIERMRSLEKSGKPVICHTARRQVYPDGMVRIEGTMGMGPDIPQGLDVAARILWGHKSAGVFGSLATCSQMARTKTYRDMGGFDPAFRRSEDTEFAVRAARAGAIFAGVEAPMVTQTMTHADEKKLEQEEFYFLKLLEKHQEFIAKHLSYAACILWVRARYAFIARRYGSFFEVMALLFIRHPLFTLRRILWAMPNMAYNLQNSKFHQGP